MNEDLVLGAVRSIAAHTCAEVLEDVVVHVCYTGTNENDVAKLDDTLSATCLRHDICQMPYNFARCNNAIVDKLCHGDKILLMNDDVILTEDAISHCSKTLDSNEQLFSVGIKLLYQDKTIQHAGHVVFIDKDDELRGVSHLGCKLPDNDIGDILTVGSTAAFLMVRRSDYDMVGGLDNRFKTCFEDCQFAWKGLMSGKLNATLNSVKATHLESKTRRGTDCYFSNDDAVRMKMFWHNNKRAILKNRALFAQTVIFR